MPVGSNQENKTTLCASIEGSHVGFRRSGSAEGRGDGSGSDKGRRGDMLEEDLRSCLLPRAGAHRPALLEVRLCQGWICRISTETARFLLPLSGPLRITPPTLISATDSNYHIVPKTGRFSLPPIFWNPNNKRAWKIEFADS